MSPWPINSKVVQRSLILLNGIQPKIVSERLGHATVGITLDTYSHVLPGLQGEAARDLDEWLRVRPRATETVDS